MHRIQELAAGLIARVEEGRTLTEALAAGLPVLTTTGGALADTLPPGAGLAVPPGDTEALASLPICMRHMPTYMSGARRNKRSSSSSAPMMDSAYG